MTVHHHSDPRLVTGRPGDRVKSTSRDYATLLLSETVLEAVG